MPAQSELLEQLEVDPYACGVELVALTVQGLPALDQRGEAGMRIQGEEIWKAAQRALYWWTPARTEEEALRRAADSPTPSVIGREVAVFSVLYERYATAVVAATRSYPHLHDYLRLLLGSIRTTVEALERRAHAAEARATDYRLRYEFEKLRQVVAGRELASKIAALIEEAAKSTASFEHLGRVYVDALPRLERLQSDLAVMSKDTTYVADMVMEESVRRMLPTERVKEGLALLGNLVTGGSFLQGVLSSLARMLP